MKGATASERGKKIRVERLCQHSFLREEWLSPRQAGPETSFTVGLVSPEKEDGNAGHDGSTGDLAEGT